MLSPEQTTDKTLTRRNLLNDEQILCNQALTSGEYDEISDEEWVAMCEKVAAKSGKGAPLVTDGGAE
jgi:hypothetical protein